MILRRKYMVNTRSKMRRSNQKVVTHMLNKLNFDIVYLQQHLRWDTITYFKGGKKLKSKDMIGLFDGFGIKDAELYFIQISTNRFHPIAPYKEFCDKHKIKALLINVKDKKGVTIKRVG